MDSIDTGHNYSKEDILSRYQQIYAKNLDNRYQQFFSLVPLECSVLDFGCGCGINSFFMAKERGCHVTGIDYSKNDISVANKTFSHPNLVFSEESIEQLKSESFDTVCSNQVIEHTHNPGNYLAQCSRVLKEDGKLIISLPNVMNFRFLISQLFISPKRLKKWVNKSLFEYSKTHTHIQSWDVYHFVNLLGSCGFKVVDYFPSEGIPLPFNFYIKFKYIPFLKFLSYTMIFVAKKEKNIVILNND